MASSPAASLFLQRARTVAPDLHLSEDNASQVAEICRRLAGIPLALELAAARSRLLDPATLLARLDEAALDGARDLPARQRTMTATLDWSYGLLTGDEQTMLRPLSVFAGGFRLDDVEAVARHSGLIDAEAVLPLLHALSEQSLVIGRPALGPVRLQLLEPVAQYARARLSSAATEDPAVGAAHTRHFLAGGAGRRALPRCWTSGVAGPGRRGAP